MEFPKDSFPHKSIIEWWYFNGQLYDKMGNRYSFMNCLFKTDPRKTSIPIVEKIPAKEVFFSHSLFTNHGSKKVDAHTNPVSIVSKDSFKQKGLFINYLNPSVTGYINNEIIETGKFTYKLKNQDLDLTIIAKKRPFLHNGAGHFDIRSRKVFYYSLTNMSAKGIVRVNGKQIKVSGKAWMDHEWSSFAGEKNWNWFSIQLNNNTEIMIQDYNDRENTYVGINYSQQKHEFASDIKLMPLKFWESKITGAKYPVKWEILVPSKNISLIAKAPLSKHEIIFGSLNYWEGPINVAGTVNGKKVEGCGFMELTGRKANRSKMHIYNHQLKNETSFYLNIARKEAAYLFKNMLRK